MSLVIRIFHYYFIGYYYILGVHQLIDWPSFVYSPRYCEIREFQLLTCEIQKVGCKCFWKYKGVSVRQFYPKLESKQTPLYCGKCILFVYFGCCLHMTLQQESAKENTTHSQCDRSMHPVPQRWQSSLFLPSLSLSLSVPADKTQLIVKTIHASPHPYTHTHTHPPSFLFSLCTSNGHSQFKLSSKGYTVGFKFLTM